ncbi:DUF2249 domain-containing protein [Opitutia bacterium ISCC 51]|nr:DUF2249 domain-containing protein [Opitutae bacterium ISCC 51]QXD30313.1 DUF2249 domain-containing protein [Opitutae bacterium ISCC 52]
MRPICDRGESPLGTILDAAERLTSNQDLVIIVPFEPLPLYGLLAQRGFSHSSKLRSEDAWEVTFHPDSNLF